MTAALGAPPAAAVAVAVDEDLMLENRLAACQ